MGGVVLEGGDVAHVVHAFAQGLPVDGGDGNAILSRVGGAMVAAGAIEVVGRLSLVALVVPVEHGLCRAAVEAEAAAVARLSGIVQVGGTVAHVALSLGQQGGLLLGGVLDVAAPDAEGVAPFLASGVVVDRDVAGGAGNRGDQGALVVGLLAPLLVVADLVYWVVEQLGRVGSGGDRLQLPHGLHIEGVVGRFR